MKLSFMICCTLTLCSACSGSPLPVLTDSTYMARAENKPVSPAISASTAPPDALPPHAVEPNSPAAKVADIIVPSASEGPLAPLLLVDRKSRWTLCRVQVQEEGGLGLQVMVIAPDGQSHQNIEVCDPNECKGARSASVKRLEVGLSQLGIGEVEPVPVSPWPARQVDVVIDALGGKLSVKAGKATLTRKALRPAVLGTIETSKSNKTRLTAFAYSPLSKMILVWTAQDPDTTYNDGSGLPDEVYAWPVP